MVLKSVVAVMLNEVDVCGVCCIVVVQVVVDVVSVVVGVCNVLVERVKRCLICLSHLKSFCSVSFIHWSKFVSSAAHSIRSNCF